MKAYRLKLSSVLIKTVKNKAVHCKSQNPHDVSNLIRNEVTIQLSSRWMKILKETKSLLLCLEWWLSSKVSEVFSFCKNTATFSVHYRIISTQILPCIHQIQSDLCFVIKSFNLTCFAASDIVNINLWERSLLIGINTGIYKFICPLMNLYKDQ